MKSIIKETLKKIFRAIAKRKKKSGKKSVDYPKSAVKYSDINTFTEYSTDSDSLDLDKESPENSISNKSDDRKVSVANENKDLEDIFPFDEVDKNRKIKSSNFILDQTSIVDNDSSVEVTLNKEPTDTVELEKLNNLKLIVDDEKKDAFTNQTQKQLDEYSVASKETLKTSNKFNRNPSITTKFGNQRFTIFPYKNSIRKFDNAPKLRL